jgi:2,4-dienoyl-CoA reductase-like NADH-dependent reductase (Old Yellow Enzyme family)
MSHVLQPLTIGPLTLANRLVMPPMATARAASDGKVTPGLLEYYAEKSAGGYLGLIIIEHSYVRPDGKARENQLSAADDSAIAGLHELAAGIHGNGTPCVLQINHAGSATTAAITGAPPVGPSAVANPRQGSVPRPLTPAEIEELVAAFGAAARRARVAGFDGVEIHSAHGYLLNQFFSPLTNQRDDEYGGDLRRRIRLHLRVIAAVREAVGKDFPIFLRLGASDFADGGTTIENSRDAAREFAEAGVGCLDISGGFSGYSVPGLEGQGYFAPLSAAVKQAVKIPVILTGGITEPQAAQALLAAGQADLIGVGRALLQDSGWARRAVATLQASG